MILGNLDETDAKSRLCAQWHRRTRDSNQHSRRRAGANDRKMAAAFQAIDFQDNRIARLTFHADLRLGTE